MITRKLFLKVRETIKKHKMLARKDKVLIAVSGGIDSMVLLHLLIRMHPKGNIAVVHINHKLRGKESDKDAEFVKRFCKRQRIKFYLVKLDLKRKSAKVSSKQDFYRTERLSKINEIANKNNYDAVVFAHTLTDQVETFFMRLFRGTSPSGLVGIHPVNMYKGVRFIRPLIETTREEIEVFAKENTIRWREDSTNKKDIYLRNALRHNLIPIIKERFGVDIDKKILHTTTLLEKDEEYLDNISVNILNKLLLKSRKSDKLPTKDIADLEETILRRIVRLWIMRFDGTYYSPEASKIETIFEIIRDKKIGKVVAIKKNVYFVLKRNYATLTIEIPNKNKIKTFRMVVREYKNAKLKEFGIKVSFKILKRVDKNVLRAKRKWSQCFDFEKVKSPIVIRSRKAGDKFQPLGMKGSMKLKDFFINEKIPVEKRSSIPIFETNGKIFWIAGFRIDEKFKVGKDTEKVLMITLSKKIV